MADILDKFGKFLILFVIFIGVIAFLIFGTDGGRKLIGNAIIVRFNTPQIDGIELQGSIFRTCWRTHKIGASAFLIYDLNQNLSKVSYNKFQVGQFVNIIEREGELLIIGEKYYWGKVNTNPDYLRLLIINKDCSINSEDIHVNDFNRII